VRFLTLRSVILHQQKNIIMKKQNIKTLKITKSTISKMNELQKVYGGGTGDGGSDSFGPECMEDFTLGCSPTFLNQCPSGPMCLISDGYTCTQPQYCW
jgi:hypothetical protein